MKLTLVFLCAFVVISHQQFQQRPRGVIWLAPYYSRPQPVNGHQAHYYNDAPYINQGFAKGQLVNQDNLDETDDYQSRITGSFGQQPQQNARFFFNPISNPFAAAGMSVPTVVVTTVASIVTCVPAFNFAAGVVPPVACRKRRNIDDAEDTSFSILPSNILKLMPTALPSSFDLKREKRLSLPTIDQEIHESIISSKDDVPFSDISKSDQMNMRERRFFFNNNAATSMSTSYIFVPTTLTKTINLLTPAPIAQCAETGNTANPACACLPPGYIVCP